MDALVILIPLLPFLAAAAIGSGYLFGVLKAKADDSITADIAIWAMTLSCLMAVALMGADLFGKNQGYFSIGQWLGSDSLNIRVNFITTGFNVRLAVLFALLLTLISRFSIDCLHKNAGAQRLFFILSLFASALLLLVLSANAVGTFFGWEVAGLCSYLLIAYSYQHPVASGNATRVWVTHRVGDAGFIIGIALSYAWADSVNWSTLNAFADRLTIGEATGIGLCFALAAGAKSAQLPFTPWLLRAMTEPTPASVLLAHSGIYLLCLLEPIFMQSPFARAVLGLVGLATAVYSFIVGLSQTDIKSSLVLMVSAQLGLMFLECGLGFWNLATWHLGANAIVSCSLLLVTPSPVGLKTSAGAKDKPREISGWLYMLSMQHFWLEQMTHWALVKPTRGLAHDLSYFDEHIVDRIIGAPTDGSFSPPRTTNATTMATGQNNMTSEFARGSGLAGQLTEWTSALLHWFEDRFVLLTLNKHTIRHSRRLGHAVNQFEQLILRPRYLVLFVCITFLVAF